MFSKESKDDFASLFRKTKTTNTVKRTFIVLTDRNKIHYAVDQSKPPWNGKRMPSWLRTKERNREVVKVQMSSRFSHRIQWCWFGGKTRVDKGSGLRKQTLVWTDSPSPVCKDEAFYRGPTGKGLHCVRERHIRNTVAFSGGLASPLWADSHTAGLLRAGRWTVRKDFGITW